MKLNLKTISGIILCPLALIACSDNEPVIHPSGDIAKISLPPVKVVKISNGKIITGSRSDGEDAGNPYSPECCDSSYTAFAFESQESFEQFKEALAICSYEQKMDLIQSYGITNLHQLSEIADEELDSIGENAISEADFRQKYGEYTARYNGLLMTNYLNSLDLDLYVPGGDEVESYIANTAGLYVIADSIYEHNYGNDLPNNAIQDPGAYGDSGESGGGESSGDSGSSTGDDGDDGEYGGSGYSGSGSGSGGDYGGGNGGGNIVLPPRRPAFPLVLPENITCSDINEYAYVPKSGKRVFFWIARKRFRVKMSLRVQKKMWYGWKSDKHRYLILEPHFTSNNFSWWATPLGRYWNHNKKRLEFEVVDMNDISTLQGFVLTWTDFDAEFYSNGNIKMVSVGNYSAPMCNLSKSKTVRVNLPHTY